MKVLSRDFTLKEKILIFVLLLILVALTYYRFVHVPCNEAIETARSEKEMYDTELLAVQKKEAQIRAMKEELDSLGELQATSRMESYNNSKAELSLLNSVLESAYNYSISFASVTRSGDQIRRNFNLQFTTGSFDAAKQIISSLADSEYRCLIGGVKYSSALRRAENGEPTLGARYVDGVYYFDSISVTTDATFFETMYGGTPDAGLPKG
jgi:hypothetical protein